MRTIILPYNGDVQLTSPYGYRILNGKTDWHNGIDFVGKESKIIISPCNGEVVSSTIITDKKDKTWEWGNYIKINVDNFLSVFVCHLNERFVKVGDKVKRGEAIGIEGETGYTFGRHCHLEVRENNIPVNPCKYLGIYNGEALLNNEKIGNTFGHDWSEKALQWALENGILKGYSDGEETR